MRIAVCQYQITAFGWGFFAMKIEALVVAAKQQEAQLLMLPEYACLDIGKNSTNDKDLFASLQPTLSQYRELFQRLAIKYQLYIQAGTTLVAVGEHRYANRAYFFAPSGNYAYQDKLHLTPYEKKTQLLVPGAEQCIFETRYGKMAIAICYDCEFPERVRALTMAGAWLILVPSYTTSLAGYHRVSLSCRARAIENQCYVANSCMVGLVDLGAETAEETTGYAGVYGPADLGFPADGVIEQGTITGPAVLSATLNYESLEYVRKWGDVLNYVDGFALSHDQGPKVVCHNLV